MTKKIFAIPSRLVDISTLVQVRVWPKPISFSTRHWNQIAQLIDKVSKQSTQNDTKHHVVMKTYSLHWIKIDIDRLYDNFFAMFIFTSYNGITQYELCSNILGTFSTGISLKFTVLKPRYEYHMLGLYDTYT